ncbi:tripartite tricarboxylate transporter substrate binding protein [Paenibacillus xerothermodurans]|uniref:Tripartite tricarboxylate transporter substrate binding protein n=1 Tax=Paenibacillus xerothermodurans TaxID=1977292 RepID=A0A2W1P2P9_PAEXE|nr:tripartite tricarboxylate transporter substrate binding protein [Paenibacillus xerothermodurans]PZE21408.1 tripartite tricarboxylate transporter substrate binding protein [Paenibacillus xerothermodurans]
MKIIGKRYVVAVFTVILALGTLGCSADKWVARSEYQAGAERGESDYPNKDVELVVGYTAGGGTDVVARIVVEAANKYMPRGKRIVVTTKPGSSGTIALADVMQAQPDGYKLGSVTTGNLAIQPNYGQTPFQSNSFIPLAQFNSAQNLLAVRADAPWQTYDEWLAWVKKHPGHFTYGSSGAGNSQHLAMEAVNILEGIQTKHVPFDGAALSITALLGGHVDGIVLLSQEAKNYVDSGRIRVLANAGTSEIPAFQHAVFLRDKGFIGLDTWSGVVAPKDTPPDIVNTLRDVFRQALLDPATTAAFSEIGIEPAYQDSERFAKTIAQTNHLTRDVAKVIGLVK